VTEPALETRAVGGAPLALKWRLALARSMSVTTETRRAGVAEMLARHRKDRVGYWFQLVLAIGIATFGLVVGSTGVVIGAMLVSPLMGPIVEVGMGLVTGAPLLVIRSVSRVFMSILVVVAGSAALSWAVPLHEVNSEILARTSPTLIDLYVACFCAFAAAYTTVRQSSATVSAAAGTSISIALVPPLCVVGWGLGSARYVVARGAAMLFTANFAAIVLFAMVAFFLLAYDTVDARTLEAEGVTAGTFGDRIAARLRTAFGSKYGPLLRVGMPLLFVAIIFVPLRTALREVAWKVRVREQVVRVLDGLPEAKRAVRSNVTVELDAVTVQLFIVGDAKHASVLKSEVATRIAEASKVNAVVDVVAVPDLEALRLATQVSTPSIAPVRVAPLAEVRDEVAEEVRAIWPTSAAGQLVAASVVLSEEGPVRVEVVHFGEALGAAGESLLSASLSERLRVEARVVDKALRTNRYEASSDDEGKLIAELLDRADMLSSIDAGYLCVSMAGRTKAKVQTPSDATRTVVLEVVRRLGGRAELEQGAHLSTSVRVSPTPCSVERANVLDAGADSASPDGGR
jgi:uncharacterized hydrophobic protein (TIGR00271 family)